MLAVPQNEDYFLFTLKMGVLILKMPLNTKPRTLITSFGVQVLVKLWGLFDRQRTTACRTFPSADTDVVIQPELYLVIDC